MDDDDIYEEFLQDEGVPAEVILGRRPPTINREKPLRYAFGCQKRVGKDTSCEYLRNKYGGIILSFAGAIYEILGYAQDKIGIPREKDREFLQWMGDWAKKRKTINVWVDLVKKKIEEHPNENIFVSDVRYPYEVDMLESLGFTLVRIKRGARLEMLEASALEIHSSENALITSPNPKWHFVIINEGTLLELFEMLDEMLQLPPQSRLRTLMPRSSHGPIDIASA